MRERVRGELKAKLLKMTLLHSTISTLLVTLTAAKAAARNVIMLLLLLAATARRAGRGAACGHFRQRLGKQKIGSII
jgi:hypothetical protein